MADFDLGDTVRERLREAALLQEKQVTLQAAARSRAQQAASQSARSTPAKVLVPAPRFDINCAALPLQPDSAEHADILLRLKLVLPELRTSRAIPVLRVPGTPVSGLERKGGTAHRLARSALAPCRLSLCHRHDRRRLVIGSRHHGGAAC